MSIFDYSRTPLNREAARVTSQAGCASDGTLTNEQKRENLIARLKVIDAEIVSLPKKSKERKNFCIMKNALQLEVNKLRPKIKLPTIINFVIGAMKEEVTPYQYKKIMAVAAGRARDALGQEDPFVKSRKQPTIEE